MQTLSTRYEGSESRDRLFQLFNRHRYSGRPHQNALEVRQAKQMMQQEAGEVRPQVFTELNYSTGGHWRRPTTTFTNDTPDVFAAMAAIWGWMMEEQGVAGIYVFKLNAPGIWSWKDTGRFSNTVTYSMPRERDPGHDRNELEQISYGTKNFEICRLFSKGFHGSRPLLRTDIECSDLEYRSWTTFVEADRRFFIWSVQVNESVGYELEFDLSQFGLPPGALITAETVSGARHGEVTEVMSLPASQKVRLHQPPQSGMLLTVHAKPLTRRQILPRADATVQQGELANRNFGTADRLRVGRHAESGRNCMSYLQFQLPEKTDRIERAVLQLQRRNESRHAYNGGFLFRVYAIPENDWDEQQITAANAPNLCRTVAVLQEIDLQHFPVGHATCFHHPSALRIDVTQAVQGTQRQGQRQLSLMLIREQHWPGEQTDDVSAVFSSREAGLDQSPVMQLWQ